MSVRLLQEQNQDGWVRLTMSDPERRQALSQPMVLALTEAFARLVEDPGVRAVVLRGSQTAFCAGGDIRDLQALGPLGEREAARENRRFGDLLELMSALPAPLIAVVQGPAMGGGCGLACVADLVLADESASFALSEPRLGLIPAQIAPFVVARLGWAAARVLALSATRWSARDAQGLGLVDFVEPDAQALEVRLLELLEALRQCAPGAIAATKKLLADCRHSSPHAFLDEASIRFARAVSSAEGREGLSAFVERRKPAWAV